MLDQAFDALKTYDWGSDLNQLKPIDDAVIATQKDAAARKALETRLVEVLGSDASRDAKDFVCRTLMVIGSAAAVPALAALLPEHDHSHMSRYALERIPADEAARALRESLSKVSGPLKVGVIGSLGVRRDETSVPALAALLADADTGVARAAAAALGDIATPDAAKALMTSRATNAEVPSAANDARLACADGLLAAGKKSEALALYKSLVGEDQPKHVRLAGTRGMLACAGKAQ